MAEHNSFDPSISAIFESAAKIAASRQSWHSLGYTCDPCAPDLPIIRHEAYFVETPKLTNLIARILEFIQNDEKDFLILLGPQGSGKTTFSHIFTAYSEKLGITTRIQDAQSFLSSRTVPDLEFFDNLDLENQELIFLDNAFSIFRLLPKLLSLESNPIPYTPKIIAIMDSTQFEIYRRYCMLQGDGSYRHFLRFPGFTDDEMNKLLSKRVSTCYTQQEIGPQTYELIRKVAELAFGNPGLGIRILSEILTFSQTLEEIQFSFGLDTKLIDDFPPSKTAILREILIREVQKDAQLVKDQDYIIHKELTSLMNKTKSTISHHLGDLLNGNLIYEQPTTRDRRIRAYRPNSAIFGILEQLAFESSSVDDVFISTEGMNREK